MAKDLIITEAVKSDISTVYAYFTDEYFEKFPEYYTGGSRVKVHSWSVFNDAYEYCKERDFIAKLDAENPGKYKAYHIAWDNCN